MKISKKLIFSGFTAALLLTTVGAVDATTLDDVFVDSDERMIIRGSLTMQDCTFSNYITTTPHSIGALYVEGDTTLTNCDFNNNTSEAGGGAFSFGGNVTINATEGDSTTFTGNSCGSDSGSSYGGAIGGGSNGVSLTINGLTDDQGAKNIIFSQNSAYAGGAIFLADDMTGTTITDTAFLNNTAISHGGAIYQSCPLILKNSSFQGNIAGQNGIGGGAIYMGDPLTITSGDFIGNSAARGGAIMVYSSPLGLVDITDTIFYGNKATVGGAIYCDSSTMGVNFTVSDSVKPNLINPSSSPALVGDNDIACSGPEMTFVKKGEGLLAVNTNNSGWLGNTTVESGSFKIGLNPENTDARWGKIGSETDDRRTVGGNLTVNSGARFGGYGRIEASTATFQESSHLFIGLTPSVLISGIAQLTLQNSLTIDPTNSLLRVWVNADSDDQVYTPGTYPLITYASSNEIFNNVVLEFYSSYNLVDLSSSKLSARIDQGDTSTNLVIEAIEG